jgi:cytochrome c biogenesis protein CcmG/thiol:disulfide interchange protein DsbE
LISANSTTTAGGHAARSTAPGRRRSARLAVVLAALLAVGALAACGDDDAGNPDSELTPEQASAPLEGAPAPLVAIREQANELLDGGKPAFERRLEELRGIPVVVNKWASWCGPCRLEFPFFQAQAEQHGDEVAFLGVLSNDSDAGGESFLEQLPVPYPSYVDPDQEIAAEIGAPVNFPATAFYDSAGELVFTRQGQYRDEAQLAAEIDRYAE